MSEMTRRELMAAVAAMTTAAAIRPAPASAQEAARRVTGADGQYDLKVYTPHEFATVTLVADMLIPRDERSGSASDAGVPQWMDAILDLEPGMRTAHRGGLAWLDHECRERFGKRFIECSETERTTMLDLIAYPKTADPELSHGVSWFTSVRDFVASGFWTSQIGVKDLGYMGNQPVLEWTGCPDEANTKAELR